MVVYNIIIFLQETKSPLKEKTRKSSWIEESEHKDVPPAKRRNTGGSGRTSRLR